MSSERIPRPEKPTDTEREALIRAILSVRWANGDPLSGVTSRTAQMIAEPILAAGFRRQGPVTEHAATYDGAHRCSVCFAPVTTEFDPITDRATWVHVEAARDAS